MQRKSGTPDSVQPGPEEAQLLQQLQENQARLQLVQQAANIGIFDWNIQTGLVTWSKEAEELFGLQPGGFQESFAAWEACLHPDDLPEARRKVFESIDRKTNLDVQFRVIWPDDQSIHWIYAKARTFYDQQEKPVRMLGINIDITERKLLERQKDEFIGIVSHELRTPVTSLKAFAQLLQKRFNNSGDYPSAALLMKMGTQIDKLTRLIEDLIDVTRVESGTLQLHATTFELLPLIDEIIEEIQRTTTQHTILTEGTTSCTIQGDKNRLGQVLINLLSNAIKYSPRADTVLVRIASDHAQVTISVQDFGMGIPLEKQRQIFQRFYRADEKALETIPGMGLGLYISAEMIGRHGGTIGFNSTPGQGSTFFFSIPLLQAQHFPLED